MTISAAQSFWVDMTDNCSSCLPNYPWTHVGSWMMTIGAHACNVGSLLTGIFCHCNSWKKILLTESGLTVRLLLRWHSTWFHYGQKVYFRVNHPCLMILDCGWFAIREQVRDWFRPSCSSVWKVLTVRYSFTKTLHFKVREGAHSSSPIIW